MQESLDKALIRPGRFDRIVQLTLPDMQGRLEILQHYAKVTLQHHNHKALQLDPYAGLFETVCPAQSLPHSKLESMISNFMVISKSIAIFGARTSCIMAYTA